MIAMAHRHGARVLVDGAQAVSHMPRRRAGARLRLLRVLRPQGVRARPASARVYGKRDVLERDAALAGRRQHDRGRHLREDRLPAAARRASRPAPATSPTRSGLGAALDYVERIGMREHRALRARAARVRDRRSSRPIPGLRLIGTAPREGGRAVVRARRLRTEDVGAALDREGIAVRVGPPLRAADPAPLRPRGHGAGRLALYNTCEDLDALVDALRRLQAGQHRGG